MKHFQHHRATDVTDALREHDGQANTHYLAAGTSQIDLMKLGVLTPTRIVDISGLRHRDPVIEDKGDWLRLDAFVTMRQALEHPVIRTRAPVIAEALAQSASRQIRSMATLGGNLLQRTRCGYYRDLSWTACNRRSPGTGCAAIEGTAWAHAVLGTSESCIAIYPGDLAQALLALDATLEIEGRDGPRLLPVSGLHRLPDDAPHRETNLAPTEIITAIRLPLKAWFARSRYVKVRDRASYEFALASCAVALDIADGVVREARIAIGGSATVPWRASAAEAVLLGRHITHTLAAEAAGAAFADARAHADTQARRDLGRATLVRAVTEVAAMQGLR